MESQINGYLHISNVPKKDDIQELMDGVSSNYTENGHKITYGNVLNQFENYIDENEKNKVSSEDDYTTDNWENEVKAVNPTKLSTIELVNKFDSIGLVGSIRDSNINNLNRQDIQNDILSSQVKITNESNRIASEHLKALQAQNMLLEMQLNNSIVSDTLGNELKGIEIAKGKFEITGKYGREDDEKQLENSQRKDVIPIIDKALKDSEKSFETSEMNKFGIDDAFEVMSEYFDGLYNGAAETVSELMDFPNPFDFVYDGLRKDIELEMKRLENESR